MRQLRAMTAMWCIVASGVLHAQQVASPVWVNLSVGSIHAKDASQYNQSNLGLGLEWEFSTPYVSQTKWVAGRFLNSDRHYSNYAGVLATPLALYQGEFKVNAGLVAGTINGYPRAWQGAYFPLLAPVIELKYKAIGANLFVIPPVKGIPVTLALQVKFNI